MWKLLVLLSIGLALASYDNYDEFYRKYPSQRQIEDDSYQTNKEYQYFYDGQVMTGIPGSSKEHSATRIQALAVFQFQGSTVQMKLLHVRMGKVIERISHPRTTLPFSVFEEVEIQQKHKEQLLKPVKFSYTNGMISQVMFEQGEEPWSANIKRGVFNMLQVNLQEQEATDSGSDLTLTNSIGSQQPQPNRFYRVMEKTLEGECETVYDVNRMPCYQCDHQKPVLNVTKSINFERCTKRPQIKYNWRYDDVCPTCDPKYTEDEKYLKSSTVMKYNISGTRDSYLIESAKVESQYTVVLYNEHSNVVNSYVNQTLTLIKTRSIQSRISGPSNPIRSDSDMVYSMDWDVLKEKFFMLGDDEFQSQTPYSEVTDKVAFAEDLLRKLVRHMREDVETTAPKVLSRLVTLFRMLKKSEIEQIHQKFYQGNAQSFTPEEKKITKDLLVSITALAGTKDSVSHLTEKIKSKELSTVESVIALRELAQVRVVSKTMKREIKSLCDSPVSQESFAIRQQCHLTLGNLVNNLCKPSQDRWAIESKSELLHHAQCSREEKEEYVNYFIQKMKSASKWEDKILYVKALGNTGIDLAVFPLQKIIQQTDGQHSTVLRTEAVLAMHQLIDLMPKKVQKILVPIYTNRYEPPTLRMVSALIIMESQPERPVLEIMAKNLHTEPSRQVASFVHSVMENYANATQPCYQKLAADLKIAMRFTKKPQSTYYQSKSYFQDWHSWGRKLGLDTYLNRVNTNRSMIPHYLSTGISGNFMGFFQNKLLYTSMVTDQLEPLLYKLFSKQGIAHGWSLSSLARHPRNTHDSYGQEMRQIFEQLNIQNREFASEPKVYFTNMQRGMVDAYIPISTSTIQELIRSGKLDLSRLESKLRSGVHFNKYYGSMLTQSQYKIPTTVGMPLVVRQRAPLVAAVKGFLKLEMQNGQPVVKVEVKPSVAAQYSQTTELWSPIVNSGSKITAKAKVFLPIKADIKMVKQGPKTEIKIEAETPTQTRELVVLETTPEVCTLKWPVQLQQWEEPQCSIIQGRELNRVSTFDKKTMDKFLGVEFRIRGLVHRTPKKHLTGTPFCPMSGPNKIVITAKPGQDKPRKIQIKLTRQSSESVQEPLSTSFRNYFYQSSERSSQASGEQSSQRSGERSSQTSQESFDQYSHEMHKKTEYAMEIKTMGSSTERNAKAKCSGKYSPQYRLSKLQCKMESSPIPQTRSQPAELCTELEILYPKQVESISELSEQKILAQAKLNWGSSCSSDRYINIKLQSERSREQTSFERRMLEEYQECKREEAKQEGSPIVCQEYLVKATRMHKYKIEMEYNQVPVSVQNATNWIWRYTKNKLYSQSDVASVHVQNPQNNIKATVRIDPYSNKLLNITVKTPKQNVTIVDIPMPFKAVPLSSYQPLRRRILSSFLPIYNYPVCKVKNDRYIQTFDGVKYSALSTCYSVLAKDCSEEQAYSVLIKKISPDSNKKQLKILTQYHKIEIKPVGGSLKVKVNGQEKNVESIEPVYEHSHQVLRIEKIGEYHKISLPDVYLKVYFDGYSCNVKTSPLYMHRQCGLCGHMDNEISDEYRSPSFEQLSDVREFVRAYTIQDGSCELPETEQICEDSSCSYRESRCQEYSSSESQEYEKCYERTTLPVRLNTVTQRLNEICFSKQSHLKCPDYTSATSSSVAEDEFCCYRQDSFRPLELLVQARSAPVDQQLTGCESSFTGKVNVDTLCSRH